jgi:hypothetical protein
LEHELEFAEGRYLSERGWEHTSSFPDACWRWTKEVEGKTLAVSRNSALSLEQALTCRACNDDNCEECKEA